MINKINFLVKIAFTNILLTFSIYGFTLLNASPPVGNYNCFYWGYDYSSTGTGYKMNTSSLSSIRILSGQKMRIVGENVSFRYSGSTLTLLEGEFKGATAHYQLDSDDKPAIVFKRKENEAKGHKIDISDTWCYLEQ